MSKEQEMALKNTIFKAMVGSNLYGTNHKDSDKDYVGIFIPDKEYVMGLPTCDQVEIRTNPSSSGRRNNKDDVDTVLYSLPKFIKLAYGNNPNIVELFFINESKHIVYDSDLGKRLRKAFPLFISKKVKDSFLGYAISQKRKVISRKPIGDRKIYIEKFGYDVKFASHLIRLLEEGIQILVEGELSFPIPNNRYIRDVKLGQHTVESVLAKADHLENLIETAYVNSKLPIKPDYEAISQLQMDMMEDFWALQKRAKYGTLKA